MKMQFYFTSVVKEIKFFSHVNSSIGSEARSKEKRSVGIFN